MSLQIHRFVVGPLPNNLYLAVDTEAREAVVIDPSIAGDTALALAQDITSEGVRLAAIWNTHGHFDHIYDNARWSSTFQVPIWMHSQDLFLLQHLREQALWFGLTPPETVAPGRAFDGESYVTVGNHRVQVLHVPGHSPGSVAFFFEQELVCISGDVLFAGSVGRTDLPGCDPVVLRHSLRTLLSLPPHTRILPGHGEETTVEYEALNNPYCEGLLDNF